MGYGKILKLGMSELQSFSDFVLSNRKMISPRVFSEEFGKIQRGFLAGNDRDLFCLGASRFAKNLAANDNKDFAGIIYSRLCKLMEFSPVELEKYAKEGYKIAELNGDYVHMMARLNDLRKVYMKRPEKLYDYIQVLYKQEKCLKHLSKHYDSAVATYQSVSRKPASQHDYEQMLAYVQTEIGKLTKVKHPNDAMKKLLSAKNIFEKSDNKHAIKYVDMLISEIRKNPEFGRK